MRQDFQNNDLVPGDVILYEHGGDLFIGRIVKFTPRGITVDAVTQTELRQYAPNVNRPLSGYRKRTTFSAVLKLNKPTN